MSRVKKRHQGKTQLSRRNALETLNNLLQMQNPLLSEEERLELVETPRDLYNLRERIKTLSLKKSPVASAKCPKVSAEEVENVPKPVINALSTIATNAWRARNKIVDAETGEAKDEMKSVYRHAEAIFEALKQIGIEVRDMHGRPYDSGMPVKVVSFEPVPGLYKEEITETIKPMITRQGKIIQMGEVIVGTPQAK